MSISLISNQKIWDDGGGKGKSVTDVDKHHIGNASIWMNAR